MNASNSQRPFASIPNPAYLYLSDSIEEIISSTRRCIERAEGIASIFGGSGLGKSLICRVLADQLADRFQVVVMNSARLCTRRAWLQHLLFELHLPYRDRDEGELRLTLHEFARDNDHDRQAILLIVDEAHTLPAKLLEEIRLLTNIVRNEAPAVRLVLCGNLSLEEQLAAPQFESLNQRIASRGYLEPLTSTETEKYIRTQLEVADDPLLPTVAPDAAHAVHAATDGVPRLINQLVDQAMLIALADGVATITVPMIQEAWQDIQRMPAPWQEAVTGPASPEDESQGAIIEFGELSDADGSLESDVPIGSNVLSFTENFADEAVESPPPSAPQASNVLDFGDGQFDEAQQPESFELEFAVGEDDHEATAPVEAADRQWESSGDNGSEQPTVSHEPALASKPTDEVEQLCLVLTDAMDPAVSLDMPDLTIDQSSHNPPDPFAEQFQEEVTVEDPYRSTASIHESWTGTNGEPTKVDWGQLNVPSDERLKTDRQALDFAVPLPTESISIDAFSKSAEPSRAEQTEKVTVDVDVALGPDRDTQQYTEADQQALAEALGEQVVNDIVSFRSVAEFDPADDPVMPEFRPHGGIEQAPSAPEVDGSPQPPSAMRMDQSHHVESAATNPAAGAGDVAVEDAEPEDILPEIIVLGARKDVPDTTESGEANEDVDEDATDNHETPPGAARREDYPSLFNRLKG